jgi:hypothetical protein
MRRRDICFGFAIISNIFLHFKIALLCVLSSRLLTFVSSCHASVKKFVH